MKVLFSCHTPFMLAHGGHQVQIRQTQACLERLGVAAEPLRWWDEAQTGDILHHFNRIPVALLQLARQKGLRVVATAFESGLGSRPAWARWMLKWVRVGARTAGLRTLGDALGWNSHRLVDACIAMSPWEAYLVEHLFQVSPARLHTIPNGVEDIFLENRPAQRGQWLVCTATIVLRKQVVEVAEAAVRAQTPIWFIGKPYSENDAYAQRFFDIARKNPKLVRYEGPIGEREKLAQVYREARGFVLLSLWEELSLAALEAAACGCPLLLSDLPWARWYFKDNASYCAPARPADTMALSLRRFYDEAPRLPAPPSPLSWLEVAERLKLVYQSLLSPQDAN